MFEMTLKLTKAESSSREITRRSTFDVIIYIAKYIPLCLFKTTQGQDLPLPTQDFSGRVDFREGTRRIVLGIVVPVP